MRIIVLGATGHIGSYLTPLLVRGGHEVITLSRGNTLPYTPGMRRYQTVSTHKGIEIRPAQGGDIDEAEYAGLWSRVRTIHADRRALEAEDNFGKYIASLRPDAVCDLICYNEAQARQLLDAGAGLDYQLVTAGTVWVFGKNLYVPADENHPRNGFGPYGENKICMEKALLESGKQRRISVVHPGHVMGRGWIPLNPLGNFNPDVFRRIAMGEALLLPDDGVRTLQPVHAQDTAELILACLQQPEKASGEAFMSVCPRAVTQNGYAAAMYRRFGHEPQLEYTDMAAFLNSLNETDRAQSLEHLGRSPCASLEKARRILGFIPRFSAEEAAWDAISSIMNMGIL